jgi:hypothetical protein
MLAGGVWLDHRRWCWLRWPWAYGASSPPAGVALWNSDVDLVVVGNCGSKPVQELGRALRRKRWAERVVEVRAAVVCVMLVGWWAGGLVGGLMGGLVGWCCGKSCATRCARPHLTSPHSLGGEGEGGKGKGRSCVNIRCRTAVYRISMS